MSKRTSVYGKLPDSGTVLTTAEYLQTAESARVQELRYGVLHVAESPSPRHQSLLLRLAIELDTHVQQHDLGTIWIAPLDVILDPSRALVLQPDLFFVSGDRANIVTDRVWGAPDMVLEVLSPNPRIGPLHQRIKWFAQYGVRECWLVYQIAREVEVLQLGSEGVVSQKRFDLSTALESSVLPTFRTTPMALAGWADPPPERPQLR
jgi:Uma2 family endonuclease